MKISFLFLTLMSSTCYGQEGLVALNPVLKDHSISYTDPISVRSKYASVATFDARGMHHVYAITHTFLDLIQRDKVLPESLNASVILDTPPDDMPMLLKEHWEELLIQYIGIVTAALCGLLMAITIPVAGFCVCCCRCAGKCGAYPEHFDKRGDSCKRASVGVVLSVFVIAAMFGVVVAFVTNQYANEGLYNLPRKLEVATEDTSLYLDNVNGEVQTLLVTNFAELENGLNRILDESGPILKRNLAQVTQAVAIDNLADIVAGLGNVKRLLKNVKNQTEFVQRTVGQVQIGLTDAKDKLVSALQQCNANQVCSTFMQEYDIDRDLAVARDFMNLNLTNVSPLLNDITDLMESDIEKKVRGGQKQLDKVKIDIENSMGGLRPKIKSEIRKMGQVLEERASDIESVLTKAQSSFAQAQKQIPEMEPFLDDYGIYIYYIGLGMSCLVLLILSCHILGLFYGFCGKRPGNVYGDECCNRGTGANWLLAGVYLTFLFSLVLLALTTALFLVGSTAEKVACEALHHPENSEVFKVLDQKFIQPLIQSQYPSSVSSDNLSLRHIMSNCHHNETLYNLLNLKNIYDVEDLKHWKRDYGIGNDISSLKNKIRLDDNLRGIEILTPQAKKDLLQLAHSELSDLKVSQYTKLMQEQITQLDLDVFIQKLRRVKNRLESSGNNFVSLTIGNQILFLEQMQKLVVQLEMGIRQLQDSVEQLERDAKFNKVSMKEALEGLIEQASAASQFLRNQGPELVDKLANSYVNETVGKIDEYVNRVVNYTTNHIGRCEPLSTTYNATVVAVCNEIVDPFNGFWASIGWCYLFYLPSIALAIVLVSLYRKSEPYPGPLVEVQPEDVGPPANSKKKHKRGHRRNASEYLPDSAHYRAGYSYQDRENRFQDAAARNYDLQQGSAASQPTGGPPRYTSNPNLAAEVNPEYERPPPYYFPGATPASNASEVPPNRS